MRGGCHASCFRTARGGRWRAPVLAPPTAPCAVRPLHVPGPCVAGGRGDSAAPPLPGRRHSCNTTSSPRSLTSPPPYPPTTLHTHDRTPSHTPLPPAPSRSLFSHRRFRPPFPLALLPITGSPLSNLYVMWCSAAVMELDKAWRGNGLGVCFRSWSCSWDSLSGVVCEGYSGVVIDCPCACYDQ